MDDYVGSKMLEGVERASFETTPCLCFVGSMLVCMRYLGEEVTGDYLMGVSGGAFKLYWLPPWAPSNCDLLMIGDEPVRRAFAALGYGCDVISDMDRRLPQELYRDRIVASIDAGRPIMADGVVGPPEICVVTGYEEGGDVLRGWSYFQEDRESPFRTGDWYSGIYGLIDIGPKGPRPQERQVLRDTLGWAIQLARVPEFEGAMAADQPVTRHISGLAVYDAMARQLTDDGEFRDLDDAALEMRCIALGNDGLFLLCCKREAAARFLRGQAVSGLAGSDHLMRAAEAYDREVAALKQAHPLTPWSGSPREEQRKLLDPARRAEIARVVCEARGHEEQAVECMEAALGEIA